MRFIETIYLGCESKEHAHPNESQIIRFDESYNQSYCSMMNRIHRCFHYANVISNESYCIKPFKVCVFLYDSKKFKNTDPETYYDRIKFIFEHSYIPRCGLIVSFYETIMSKSIKSPFSTNYIWPFKDRWNGKNSDYITVQYLEDRISDRQKEKYGKCNDEIKLILSTTNYRIEEVSYTTPIKKLYEKLLHTRFHITYTGSTYYFTAPVNCPTLAYGPFAPNTYKKFYGHESGILETMYVKVPTSQPDYNFNYDESNLTISKPIYNIANIGKDYDRILDFI